VAVLFGVSGCTRTDPPSADAPIDRAGSPRPSAPTPTTVGASSASTSPPAPGFPGGARAARLEQAQADLCHAILTGYRKRLTKNQRRLLRSLRDAHDQHAAALREPDPTLRPTGSVPTRHPEVTEDVADRKLGRNLTLLIRGERALADQHRATAVGVSGPPALLWGSLSVAAGSYAAALDGRPAGSVVATPTEPTPMPLLSDVAAMQALLSQLHAVAYGYQLALGQLPAASRRHRDGLAGLGSVRRLRDQLTAALVKRSARVPIAEPAYVPSVQPESADSAAGLMQRMEVALLPFVGSWLAAARRPDRRPALDALSETAERATTWGAVPQSWPGFLP
jgi:hypothetical protein